MLLGGIEIKQLPDFSTAFTNTFCFYMELLVAGVAYCWFELLYGCGCMVVWASSVLCRLSQSFYMEQEGLEY